MFYLSPQYLPNQIGRIIKIDSGEELGKHTGIHHWTVGQRCRIGGQPKRLFIARKEFLTQDVYAVSISFVIYDKTTNILVHNIVYLDICFHLCTSNFKYRIF